MMWWEARPTLRRWVFLLVPGTRRWRMHALQRRILRREMECFPAWFPELEKPKTLGSVLKTHYRPVVAEALTPKEQGRTALLATTTTLDHICQDMFLPVAQEDACGQLQLNTGQDSSGDYWITVRCAGCDNIVYTKLHPRDYWSPAGHRINADGLLYTVKSFFAVTVKEMHHAVEAPQLRAIGA